MANRIANGEFSIDGSEYTLAVNNGPNHLHGGIKGFDKAVWKSEPVEGEDGPALKLIHTSPDGDEGYPGTLDVEVIYTLTHDDELKVEMKAQTDRPTVVNMAHHSFWNPAGHDGRDVLKHEVEINAQCYTPTDDTMIPIGEIRSVLGTPYDFLEPKRIGTAIVRIRAEQELKTERSALHNMNIALKEILARVQEEKNDIKKKVRVNVDKIIMPIIDVLMSEVPEEQTNYLVMLKRNLEEITSPFANRLSKTFMNLTHAEIQICNLIRRGLSTKEIAQLRHISTATVSRHREYIRRKLNLSNKQINLRTYLHTYMTESTDNHNEAVSISGHINA